MRFKKRFSRSRSKSRSFGKRHKLTRRQSKRNFHKGSSYHKRNVAHYTTRGGIRM